MPSIKVGDTSLPSAIKEFEKRETNWTSIWICNTLQLLNGIQFSLFYTSMWPYLKALDPDASIGFFGWVVAIFSAGQTIAAFLFGVWNQKSRSTKYPVACGIVLMAVGNLMYAVLPILSSGQKWTMLAGRFVVGFGTGNLSVLRTYVAIGSVQKDRVKALSLGIGMFVLGLSIGPAIMVIFTPIGPDGFYVGSFPITMYNSPAIVMFAIIVISLVVLFTCFEENYAGVIKTDKDSASKVTVPKFDKIPAAICIATWFALQCVATNSEVLMTPLTMALYKWSNHDAIFWNGILIALQNVLNFLLYVLIALTRLGKTDKRNMILCGLISFCVYHIVNIPWPFYDGPLEYAVTGSNLTSDVAAAQSGGCPVEYAWCSHTTRVPLPVFVISTTVILGIAYPFIGSPSGTLFSEIIGPRNQGFMQGIFAFVGSIGRFSGPIIATYLFRHSGYLWPMVLIIVVLAACIIAVIVFYRRLIPLKLNPDVGVPTKYNGGVFYRF